MALLLPSQLHLRPSPRRPQNRRAHKLLVFQVTAVSHHPPRQAPPLLAVSCLPAFTCYSPSGAHLQCQLLVTFSRTKLFRLWTFQSTCSKSTIQHLTRLPSLPLLLPKPSTTAKAVPAPLLLLQLGRVQASFLRPPTRAIPESLVLACTFPPQVFPAIQKFALCHFAFTKDLHQYLFSVPKEIRRGLSLLGNDNGFFTFSHSRLQKVP